jgi:hypothetical protein
MRFALFAALTQLLAGSLTAGPAPAGLTATHYGYYTREDYVRVERAFSSTHKGEFIVLQKFMQKDEFRLPVLSHIPGQGLRSEELHAAGGGQDVRLRIVDSTHWYIGLNGLPLNLRVAILPTPRVSDAYHGYYTRTRYARVETVISDGKKYEYLVLQEFPKVIQTRVFVTNHQSRRTTPLTEYFEAGTGSNRYRLEIYHSNPKRAKFTAPGLGTLPYTLLE